MILLHDNARPHTARLTLETVEHLGLEVLPHPSYSPDLTPSNYHLFGPMKKMLGGQKFASDDDVLARERWKQTVETATLQEGMLLMMMTSVFFVVGGNR